MAYTTLAEVKTFCQVTVAGDDTLLTAILASAEEVVENYTQRVFDAAADSIQTFTRLSSVPNRFDGQKLYFFTELAATATSITDTPTVIYLPENGPPYYGCMITAGTWAYPTVSITGKWGYSTAPPADVELAVWRICKWLYDMRHSTSGEMVVTPEGQVLIPEGLPSDIKVLLNPYRKVRVA